LNPVFFSGDYIYQLSVADWSTENVTVWNTTAVCQ